jgi:hypothetical protein
MCYGSNNAQRLRDHFAHSQAPEGSRFTSLALAQCLRAPFSVTFPTTDSVVAPRGHGTAHWARSSCIPFVFRLQIFLRQGEGGYSTPMGKVGRWVWAAMASRTAPLRETSTKIGPERRAPRTRYQMAILIQICHRARAPLIDPRFESIIGPDISIGYPSRQTANGPPHRCPSHHAAGHATVQATKALAAPLSKSSCRSPCHCPSHRRGARRATVQVVEVLAAPPSKPLRRSPRRCPSCHAARHATVQATEC